MEKNRFLYLLKNHTSLNGDDLNEVLSIQESFPYSQVIHNLASRAAADISSFSKESLLHLSAIYTTDRAVLKSLMNEPKQERVNSVNEFSASITKPQILRERIAPAVSFVPEQSDNQSLIDSIFADLENLRKSKLLYEENMIVLEKDQLEVATAQHHEPTPQIIDTPVFETLKEKEPKEEINFVETPDVKNKEQLEIIENFIRTQPELHRPKLETPSVTPPDLTEQSQHFADNVISETLVEILLKQGKKAKAIEVLKKLIWKFPQKKAYFAAQIEDLKK